MLIVNDGNALPRGIGDFMITEDLILSAKKYNVIRIIYPIKNLSAENAMYAMLMLCYAMLS